MPKVSVIIPVFNGERFLEEAIQSVLDQSFQDFEVIVVDDGSREGTERIVRQFPVPICYHWQENRGVAASRNLGVRLAQGDWIAFLDQDDTWYPNKLSVHIECAKAYPGVSLFYSDVDVVDQEGRITQKSYLKIRCDQRLRSRKPHLVTLMFDGQPSPVPSAVLIKRQVFLQAGGFSPLLRGKRYEDLELFARVAKTGSMHFIPECLVKYRVNLPSPNDGFSDHNRLVLLNSLRQLWQDEPQKQAVLSEYFARYYARQGKLCLKAGDFRKAREHFCMAFSHRPLYGKHLWRWVLSYLPGLRDLYMQQRE